MKFLHYAIRALPCGGALGALIGLCFGGANAANHSHHLNDLISGPLIGLGIGIIVGIFSTIIMCDDD